MRHRKGEERAPSTGGPCNRWKTLREKGDVQDTRKQRPAEAGKKRKRLFHGESSTILSTTERKEKCSKTHRRGRVRINPSTEKKFSAAKKGPSRRMGGAPKKGRSKANGSPQEEGSLLEGFSKRDEGKGFGKRTRRRGASEIMIGRCPPGNRLKMGEKGGTLEGRNRRRT